jgi:uncharacterized protein YbjT (DUF2867 family)
VTILLTGATGYVGGRLLERLEAREVPLRCLTRRPEALGGTGRRTEVVAGDVGDPAALDRAMAGVEVAVYLVHAMGAGGGYAERDRRLAGAFGAAAGRAGVRRIVYLGGLGSGPGMSEHLASRQEVGAILAASGVPTIELRAAIVIGAGGFSFEMVRALVERLPVMITPRWVDTPTQPIAIDDVIAYLEAAIDAPGEGGRIYEIGGPERATYAGIMREYARRRGLRRRMIRVPLLTPRLSSLWLRLVTPAHYGVGRALVDGLRTPTAVRDPAALRELPVRPMALGPAIERALAEDRRRPERAERRLVDDRRAAARCAPEAAFRPIERIGGDTGWYSPRWPWRLRWALDRLAGGQGMRPGRIHPDRLRVGDPVDFWRVEEIEPGRRLLLAARMRVPGRAWLRYEVIPRDGAAEVRQTAIFHPRGLAGLLYWYALWPVHGPLFRLMLRTIVRRGEDGAGYGEGGAAT